MWGGEEGEGEGRGGGGLCCRCWWCWCWCWWWWLMRMDEDRRSMVVLLQVVLVAAASSDQQIINNASGMKTRQWVNLQALPTHAVSGKDPPGALTWQQPSGPMSDPIFCCVGPQNEPNSLHQTAFRITLRIPSDPFRPFKDRTRIAVDFLDPQTKTSPLRHLSVQNSGRSWKHHQS